MTVIARAVEVAVVPTGLANLASVRAGLRRLGATVRLVESAAAVRDAEYLVLPGVGSYAPAVTALARLGVADALRERIEADDGRATLAVCLGMQLLFEGSDEAPNVRGLAALPGRFGRFGPGVLCPQLGWNELRVDDAGRTPVDRQPLRAAAVYFANSYRLAADEQTVGALRRTGWTIAFADHGGPFVAAVARGRALACQFHPELSGPAGQALLRRWIDGCARDSGGGTC